MIFPTDVDGGGATRSCWIGKHSNYDFRIVSAGQLVGPNRVIVIDDFGTDPIRAFRNAYIPVVDSRHCDVIAGRTCSHGFVKWRNRCDEAGSWRRLGKRFDIGNRELERVGIDAE